MSKTKAQAESRKVRLKSDATLGHADYPAKTVVLLDFDHSCEAVTHGWAENVNQTLPANGQFSRRNPGPSPDDSSRSRGYLSLEHEVAEKDRRFAEGIEESYPQEQERLAREGEDARIEVAQTEILVKWVRDNPEAAVREINELRRQLAEAIEKAKPKWGGARPGSGRKKADDGSEAGTVEVRIPEWIANLAGMLASENGVTVPDYLKGHLAAPIRRDLKVSMEKNAAELAKLEAASAQ